MAPARLEGKAGSGAVSACCVGASGPSTASVLQQMEASATPWLCVPRASQLPARSQGHLAMPSRELTSWSG